MLRKLMPREIFAHCLNDSNCQAPIIVPTVNGPREGVLVSVQVMWNGLHHVERINLVVDFPDEGNVPLLLDGQAMVTIQVMGLVWEPIGALGSRTRPTT